MNVMSLKIDIHCMFVPDNGRLTDVAVLKFNSSLNTYHTYSLTFLVILSFHNSCATKRSNSNAM